MAIFLVLYTLRFDIAFHIGITQICWFLKPLDSAAIILKIENLKMCDPI